MPTRRAHNLVSDTESPAAEHRWSRAAFWADLNLHTGLRNEASVAAACGFTVNIHLRMPFKLAAGNIRDSLGFVIFSPPPVAPALWVFVWHRQAVWLCAHFQHTGTDVRCAIKMTLPDVQIFFSPFKQMHQSRPLNSCYSRWATTTCLQRPLGAFGMVVVFVPGPPGSYRYPLVRERSKASQ